ncbi:MULTISPECIES: GNAT family N-acetyltransferase [unclassified Clostridium]|uniref:GNAT family N-acetyltransferase n=1 Tax=unclassified Clostridium TaxID=2614128 RepID=UPI000EC653C4|nr:MULTISPECIES: GNAT family N-acetyltransferase [unclassified Clostridium]HCQ89062.1 N-acetyltransferase [Clostridium sp.]
MTLENYSKEIDIYNLGDGYELQRAEQESFSKYYATYYGLQKANGWFKKNYDIMRSIIDEEDECFWILKGGRKIGGALIKPNFIEGVFLIPPYSDEYEVLKKLKEILVYWSDFDKPIEASTVDSSQVELYEKLGFIKVESGRWMIRPTEVFNINWEDDYYVRSPKREDELKMGKLLHEAFQNNEGLNFNYSVDEYTKWVKEYFDSNLDVELLNRASTLVYDKATKELVGVCYISMWQEWPLVSQIAVKPSYAGKGIGTKMLKSALTVLNEEYPVIRLYVHVGNKAEELYHNLGFLKGFQLTDMKLVVVMK